MSRSLLPSASSLDPARVALAALVALPLVACGGPSGPAPAPQVPKPAPSTTTAVAKPPPPLPVVAPQVSETPASCKEFVEIAAPSDADKKKACESAKSALATLATAATAESKGDHAARDAALRSLSDCERIPLLVTDVVRAQLAPMTCAEAILVPALEAHGKEALPQHQTAARALVGASRLARLRPAKGAFDVLAKAEADPGALETAKETLIVWRDAIEKQEGDAIGLSKGAPAEIGVLVRFEIAAAWLALAKEIRATPLPDDIKALKAKDPDIETHYFAKLDEQTLPIVDRAQQMALAGVGIAVRDGILVKGLPSFQPLLEFFRSRPGFEIRPTRELDLLMPKEKVPAKGGDAAILASQLPPWAAYASLERADPAALLSVPVLAAMAENRGIPATLRLELEKDKKLDDAHKGTIALSRTRMVLSYGSRPDAEAVATWKNPKTPVDQLRVAVDLAMLGPPASKAKLGDPLVTQSQTTYALEHLDKLAKTKGDVGLAAQYDAALLALDAAQVFVPDGSSSFTADDQKKAFEAAIARLDKVAALTGLDKARADNAKKLADGARETVKLLGKPAKP
jgi:hypothetical protein